jgi:hypothetical protein
MGSYRDKKVVGVFVRFFVHRFEHIYYRFLVTTILEEDLEWFSGGAEQQ